MSNPRTPEDGTVIPAVHGDATPTTDTGVPVPSFPPEAPGLASRAPERDAAEGPRDGSESRPGGQAAPGLRGQAFRDEAKRVRAEQAAGQRGDRGRRARYAAQRAPGAVYRAGGNRRGGRQ